MRSTRTRHRFRTEVTVLRDARAWHTSRSLHRNFCWLMGIPTGVLALAIVFWLRQFTILGATDQRAVRALLSGPWTG